MEKPEEEKLRNCALEKHRTDEIHERVKLEAEIRRDCEDIEELSAGDWRNCAATVATNIWREDERFIERCRDEWDIDRTGNEARERAKIVALKEAENGH
ncbi:hypothetical protein PM035_14240 [Halorubrum ezzemoulense]|uniref:hypothetical protein n=1 Tax=Halorubrum ezzemoulense TaxID=337243 RepID=UPI00232D1762|nr:hypothetical protein [Halorubrum ezzemoulense]MDB2262130.1 hypothetical protein [Halorubrum ezzemoulense]MDB2268843.1 hypothetical protein [Halorubrum ezzemoulense]